MMPGGDGLSSCCFALYSLSLTTIERGGVKEETLRLSLIVARGKARERVKGKERKGKEALGQTSEVRWKRRVYVVDHAG
jgi:hypothetical protein